MQILNANHVPLSNVTFVAVEKHPDYTTGRYVPVAYFNCDTSALLDRAHAYVYERNRVCKDYMRLRLISVEAFNKRNAK